MMKHIEESFMIYDLPKNSKPIYFDCTDIHKLQSMHYVKIQYCQSVFISIEPKEVENK